jgi:hypothetical protein
MSLATFMLVFSVVPCDDVVRIRQIFAIDERFGWSGGYCAEGQTDILPYSTLHAAIAVGHDYEMLSANIRRGYDARRPVGYPMLLVTPGGSTVAVMNEASLLVAVRASESILKCERLFNAGSVAAIAEALTNRSLCPEPVVRHLVSADKPAVPWLDYILPFLINCGSTELIDELLELAVTADNRLQDRWLEQTAKMLYRRDERHDEFLTSAGDYVVPNGFVVGPGARKEVEEAIVRIRWKLLTTEVWEWTSRSWSCMLATVVMATAASIVADPAEFGSPTWLGISLSIMPALFWSVASLKDSDPMIGLFLFFTATLCLLPTLVDEQIAWSLSPALVTTGASVVLQAVTVACGITGPLYVMHPSDRTLPASLRAAAAAASTFCFVVSKACLLSLNALAIAIASRVVGARGGPAAVAIRSITLLVTIVTTTGPALLASLVRADALCFRGHELAMGHRCTKPCLDLMHRVTGQPRPPVGSPQPWLPDNMALLTLPLLALAALLVVHSVATVSPNLTFYSVSCLFYTIQVLIVAPRPISEHDLEDLYNSLAQWHAPYRGKTSRATELTSILLPLLCAAVFPAVSRLAHGEIDQSPVGQVALTTAECATVGACAYILWRKRRTLAIHRFEERWEIGPGGRLASLALAAVALVDVLAVRLTASPPSLPTFTLSPPPTPYIVSATLFTFFFLLTFIVLRVVRRTQSTAATEPPLFAPCTNCGRTDSAALFLPCSHSPYCYSCSQGLGVCPDCEEGVQRIIRLHR